MKQNAAGDNTEDISTVEKTVTIERTINLTEQPPPKKISSRVNAGKSAVEKALSGTGFFSLRKRKDVDSRIEELRDKLRPGDVLFSGEEEQLDLLEEGYDLQKQFAEGGQGVLYRGFDRKLRRLVAVKSLHGNLSGNERQRRLFLTEARVTAQLDHPSIVPIYT